MISKINTLFDDDRGASTVIGVILMVAITVILAAAVSTFVLDFGARLQETPQADLDAEDAPINATVPSGMSTDLIEINHGGGDEISAGDYRIAVQVPGNSTWDTLFDGSDTDTTLYEDPTDVGKVNISLKNDTPGDFTVGDSIVIEGTDEENDGGENHNATGDYGIRIIHIPSDSIILEEEVSVE